MSAIHFDRVLPDINLLRGNVNSRLHNRFRDQVRRNDQSLKKAWINRHSWDHMDTVANGVYRLGVRMDVPWEDLMAVTLATRFHDVGYDFPSDQDPEQFCKEQHQQHAQNGADMFVDQIAKLRQDSRLLAEEVPWWTDRHTQLAHDAIRLHSNGSAAHTSEVPKQRDEALVLLPRLLDKLHNTNDRIYPEHLRLFSFVPHKTLSHIRHRIQQQTRWLLAEPRHSHHGSTKQETFEKLQEFEYAFMHRIVPHAITDQRILLHQKKGQIEVQYAVYPSRVESLLGIPYSAEDHSEHFDAAYDKSMRNAAAVVAVIRRQLFGHTASGHAPLCVTLQYNETGEEIQKQYRPTEHPLKKGRPISA